VPTRRPFDYAIVRIVPRVEREEFVNVGVIVHCDAFDFLDARIEVDERRLLALSPEVDLPLVREHLASIPRICRGEMEEGPLAAMSRRERFRWLVAPRSTVVQLSAAHAGLCDFPGLMLEHLLQCLVRPPRSI
jgi:hypothetical protein